MYSGIESVLISAEQLQSRIKELGRQISADYADKNWLLVGILRGAAIFLADLAREITVPVQLDFLVVTRYGTHDQPGEVKIIKDLDSSVKNRDLLLVEDVIDNGNTLHFLVETLKLKNPRSIKICSLFDKPERRTAPVKADYLGFPLPDRFVVGFGLDYKQKFRNLPYLATLNPGSCTYEKEK